MHSDLNHLQLNVDISKNKDFYKNLMEMLGWNLAHEDHETLGYRSGSGISLWFYHSPNQTLQDYDARGLNHIGFKVDSLEDVDNAAKFLREKGIEMLFNTPRHREEFASNENETYYQIMFESEDKILFEIIYSGPK